MVRWIFAQRLAGHSVARIARALNEAGVSCLSAAGPGRNPHRPGTGWTLGTVTTILANPRYTGRQVWNRQRTDKDLAGPADVSLGHKDVQRWNLPDGWVISKGPARPALVSEADFIAAQEVAAPRGPASPAVRRYLLAGLLTCGIYGRRLESAWSNGRPAYRCRHGYTSATVPDPARAEEHLRPRGPDPAAPGRPRHPPRRPRDAGLRTPGQHHRPDSGCGPDRPAGCHGHRTHL